MPEIQIRVEKRSERANTWSESEAWMPNASEGSGAPESGRMSLTRAETRRFRNKVNP